MASQLIELSKNGKIAALELYNKKKTGFFPLIAAVLAGSQNGQAFGDKAEEPEAILVEHNFGFAQIFGHITPEFTELLKKRLLVKKDFAPAKLRLYTPFAPDFLMVPACDSLRSERCRFYLNRDKFAGIWQNMPKEEWQPVTSENFTQVEKAFDVALRFWPNKEAFILNSFAVTIWAEDEPVSICYAAASENNAAEIDVLTRPEKRGQGYGLAAAAIFIHNCLKVQINPLWDCFTNNAGSLALASKLGYEPDEPYPFFTIPR